MQNFASKSREAISLAKEIFPDLAVNGQNDDLYMRETSPPDVTPNIFDFSEDIAGGVPVFVDVAAPASARAGGCFANVADAVAQAGGEAIHGWTIWEAPGLFNNGEFHVVWKTPEGLLLDVTPKPDGEEFIMFLPDFRYPADFDFFQRPRNVRMRVYGHKERLHLVAAKIAGFNERRLAYEMDKARRKGLTLMQSVGMGLKGRDRFEKIIDTFLEDVGALEAMLVPTPDGQVCKDKRRLPEFHRRASDVWRQKTKIFLMADMMVRGMVPRHATE
jgi:hypothetical protein